MTEALGKYVHDYLSVALNFSQAIILPLPMEVLTVGWNWGYEDDGGRKKRKKRNSIALKRI
ncbi:hypothetical protein L873DRAFT_1809505 [Choiromyces venosus 120613-1]|uniref:Uncharacterized protein n=1 Tax=Choiromyces venosus 120613-1 TaxID=1336337 RepID=A0A3N4JLP6_9PEZI|nr:hypothetical protein L873DRAFT_1809505 [Choiromyces venosus 120613-1]